MRILVLFFIFTVKFEERASFKLMEYVPTSKKQLDFWKRLQLESEASKFILFLKSPEKINEPIQVLVPPERVQAFEKLMNEVVEPKSEVKRESLDEDLQSNEVLEEKQTYTKMDWVSYHSYDAISKWMKYLAKKYRKIIEVFNYGKSFEKRSIIGVKLSYGSNRKAVFMEGGMHGSSLISPATVTYILNEFITTKNKTLKKLARRYDWYFVPSINPDSYQYVHNSSYGYSWIKTRSYTATTFLCPGVNADRNFKINWNEVGSSEFSCSDLYAGAEPFSEPETKSLAKFLQQNIKHFFAYLSFQNYGQQLMVPYGYTNNRLDNFDQMVVIAQKTAVQLHRKHKTKYRVGTTFEVLEGASGTSTDWAKACLELPVVLTFLMRPKYGYKLDPEFIIPNGQEVVDSLVVLFNETYKLGYGRFQNASL